MAKKIAAEKGEPKIVAECGGHLAHVATFNSQKAKEYEDSLKEHLGYIIHVVFAASSGGQFVIPTYQHSYTWTSSRELKQLLDDNKGCDIHFMY